MVSDIIATNLLSVISKKNIPRIWKSWESEYAPYFPNYIFEWDQNSISQQIECLSLYEKLSVVYYKGFSLNVKCYSSHCFFFTLGIFNKMSFMLIHKGLFFLLSLYINVLNVDSIHKPRHLEASIFKST